VLSCGVLVFFFFQAEDGIRDATVTGVQTCALPICYSPSRRFAVRSRPGSGRRRQPYDRALGGSGSSGTKVVPAGRTWCSRTVQRSEERRVGKGGSTRWGPAV